MAERYDESKADMFEPAVVDPAVDFLANLAGQDATLELGIGTGRIALPLARRGVRVHGIDLSEAMVARLRAKPGAEQISVTIGDFDLNRTSGLLNTRAAASAASCDWATRREATDRMAGCGATRSRWPAESDSNGRGRHARSMATTSGRRGLSRHVRP
jgi:SAM-dependent methyltransferase